MIMDSKTQGGTGVHLNRENIKMMNIKNKETTTQKPKVQNLGREIMLWIEAIILLILMSGVIAVSYHDFTRFPPLKWFNGMMILEATCLILRTISLRLVVSLREEISVNLLDLILFLVHIETGLIGYWDTLDIGRNWGIKCSYYILNILIIYLFLKYLIAWGIDSRRPHLAERRFHEIENVRHHPTT